MKKNPPALSALSALLLLSALVSACAPLECADCTRVLFIGNSYSSANNLPTVFLHLAASGGYAVETKSAAKGGWSLSDHAQTPDMQNALQKSAWDYVILQEKDEVAASEQLRISLMHPAARTLVADVRNAGATPIFFQTWARRDGMTESGMETFEAMQYEIDLGYAGVADELGVPVAPVGDAWFYALNQNPELQLWKDDGLQPAAQGTYLAACVFYAVIFNKSPAGLSYAGGLPAEVASQLQNIAAQTALP